MSTQAWFVFPIPVPDPAENELFELGGRGADHRRLANHERLQRGDHAISFKNRSIQNPTTSVPAPAGWHGLDLEERNRKHS